MYQKFSRHVLSEYKLRNFDFPRKDTSLGAVEGSAKLYGDHFGFTEGKFMNKMHLNSHIFENFHTTDITSFI